MITSLFRDGMKYPCKYYHVPEHLKPYGSVQPPTTPKPPKVDRTIQLCKRFSHMACTFNDCKFAHVNDEMGLVCNTKWPLLNHIPHTNLYPIPIAASPGRRPLVVGAHVSHLDPAQRTRAQDVITSAGPFLVGMCLWVVRYCRARGWRLRGS